MAINKDLLEVVSAGKTVFVGSASAIGKGVKTVDSAFGWLALTADDVYQDKLLLTDLKNDYREVVRTESKAAVVAGDKASILAALKAATIDLDEV